MKSRVNGEKERTPYDDALDWIYEQKTEVERAGYGKNKASVAEALERENRRTKTIASHQKQIDIVFLQVNAEKQNNLQAAYDSLKLTSQKKINCLKSIMEIASLEEQCGNVSKVFDLRAVQLVDPAQRAKHGVVTESNKPGFVALSSQDCIFATSDNWGWIVRLVQCIDLHLKNASSYQQFFHEIDESGPSLVGDLRRLHRSFDLHHLKGDYRDAEKLLRELEDVTVVLRQWESKGYSMWEKACGLVPVHLRTSGVTSPTPVRAVCHYETSEINVREGEDLLLLDNKNSTTWKVRNAAGVEADVPALCLLIPGPCKEAMEAAVTMRLQLLAEWTNTVKRIGQRLMCFMLLVFQADYEDANIKLMKSIAPEDKRSLLRILDFIDETLRVHWSDHEGFNTLQERMLMVRMILNDATGVDVNAANNENTANSLVVQVNMLEKLMQKYKELWSWWDQFKVAMETSRAPDMMLIVDKWQQLKFVSPADFAKYWKSSLQFDDFEKSLLGLRHLAVEGSSHLGEQYDDTDMQRTMRTMLGLNGNEARIANGGGVRQASVAEEESMEEEGFDEMGERTIHKASVGETEHGAFGYATERKTAETEQLSSAEMEEKKTFVIRAVVDSDTGREISLQEAIKKGILQPDEGVYINQNTGDRLPIPVAMNQGLIKVELTTTRRTQEKKSSMGIITVKTIRETIRPYTIVAVTDTRDNSSLTLDEAVTRSIIDEGKGTYRDMRRKLEMTIVEAIESGMVQAEYDGNVPESEVVSQAYAVRAVLDVKRQTTVSFAEAVRRGIIDKTTGAFRNTLTNDMMYIGDAIMRGFLKARPIDDPKTLDIDPENEMTVDKTEEAPVQGLLTSSTEVKSSGPLVVKRTTTTVKKTRRVNSSRQAASLFDNGL